jgi:hypothetical protein
MVCCASNQLPAGYLLGLLFNTEDESMTALCSIKELLLTTSCYIEEGSKFHKFLVKLYFFVTWVYGRY